MNKGKYAYQERMEAQANKEVTLTPDMVYGFTALCLVKRFDGAVDIPTFHEELWDLCCSPATHVAIAAPRNHAKSTSVTLSYLLAALLFRDKKYAIIVSDTEGQAIQFLSDIKIELSENEDIIALFGNMTFNKESATDIIIEMEDGYQFRIIVKGSEQKVRGLKWRNRRPDLIIGDDLENDEIVMNKERRKKFRDWLFKALIPCLSDTGVIRIVGTILHLDSALERLLNDDTWVSKRYRAHNADFSEILWADRFPRERLEAIRRGYISQGMPDGYSQEYLNYPIDEENAYFRKHDFLEYDASAIGDKHLNHYSAIDFAISEKEGSDYTAIVTVGVDQYNKMFVVDVRKGRWDSKEIIDEMFSVHNRYKPEIFTMEGGVIEKSLGPYIRDEMYKRSTFINMNPITPNKDKQARARSIQARMRQGGVYFDKSASYYADLEQEMLRFPRDVHDDQVDALAWIGLTLDRVTPGMTSKEEEDESWEEEYGDDYEMTGRSFVGGY